MTGHLGAPVLCPVKIARMAVRQLQRTPHNTQPPPKTMAPKMTSTKLHTARYTLSVQSRTGDNECIYTLRVECKKTLRACFCGALDEERLAERLDAKCGHRHQFRMTDGLASRLPGHRAYVEWLRRSDESTWLRAARQEREQDGQVSASTERMRKAILERRAAAKKAVAVERKRARAGANTGMNV